MSADSLQSLRDLHQDLVVLTESRLPNVERLALELETHLEAFRALLDQKPRNDASRQLVSSGKLTLDDDEYAVNSEFQQAVYEVSEVLDLDEVEAAKILLQAQQDAPQLDRPVVTTSVILFHERRRFLLENLRLALQQVNEDNLNDEVLTDMFHTFLDTVVSSNQAATNRSTYWRKCINSLQDVERWLQRIHESVQSAGIVGHPRADEFTEIMELQRASLTSQHQSLGAISYQLIRANRVRHEDIPFLIGIVRQFERYDATLIDYIPSLTGLISHFAGSESHCSLEECKALQQLICYPKDNEIWRLRTLHALILAFWLVEFSGRCVSLGNEPLNPGGDLEKESDERQTLFMEALRDGAFHVMLYLSQSVQNAEWFDPARHGFASFLLQDGPQLQLDTPPFSSFLRDIMMEQLQVFADSYVSNMPDSLRKLKFEEDEQRRQAQSRVQLRASEYDLHLERFLLVVAFAYENDPQRARDFWVDTEGNLFGFLQWASQRQSTPRIAAFCEMLMSISEGHEGSEHAHKFLLEESSGSAKLRKNSPLSWSTIFSELEYYSSNLQDRYNQVGGATGSTSSRSPSASIIEPESSMMLECYLRLISHLCSESVAAREFVLHHPSFKLVHHLFKLCSSNIDGRFRACAFTVFFALLIKKDKLVRDSMWEIMDAWIYNVASASTQQNVGARAQALQVPAHTFRAPTLASLAQGFEQPATLVALLTSLVSPARGASALGDAIPYADNLGQAYRMPGIEPYVDFVLGNVFAQKSPELHDPLQLAILRLRCLTFAATVLSSFNENLFVLAEQSAVPVDEAMDATSLDSYARLHPFGRVMEWLFNDKVIESLFDTIDQHVQDADRASTSSPMLSSMLRAVEVMELVLSHQSVYFNIVRARLKTQSSTRQSAISNSAVSSFEDVIAGKLTLIPKLCLLCISGHQELAVASFGLLRRIATSRKLALPFTTQNTQRIEKSRILTALEREGASETIPRAFVLLFEFDAREIEQGLDSTGFVVKAETLHFLNACLTEVPNRPTIAHLLLGFKCRDRTVEVAPDSLFTAGQSLFHAIVRLSVISPDGDGTSIDAPLISLVADCVAILQKLWSSPMTSAIVLAELQNLDFVFAHALRQPVIDSSTLWDGKPLNDVDFLASPSVMALTRFLQQRTAFLELIGLELRDASRAGMKSQVARLTSTLLGKAMLSDGGEGACASILELLDFSNLGLEGTADASKSNTQFLEGVDFEICKDRRESAQCRYDLVKVHELLALRLSLLQKQRPSMTDNESQILLAEMTNVEALVLQKNHQIALAQSFNATLRCWVQLVVTTLKYCSLDAATSTSFILQVLVLVLPRLERALNSDLVSAMLFCQLGRSLMLQSYSSIDQTSVSSEGDALSDKLFVLFRTVLLGLSSFETSSDARQMSYQIGLAHLQNAEGSKLSSTFRRKVLHLMKQGGDHLFGAICDDAYSAQDRCKESALLLLERFVAVANSENAKVVIDQLVRLNFLEVTLESIKTIPAKLRETSLLQTGPQLSDANASLALLLRISQTRHGAAVVMNSGFFAALRASGLFAVDPDLGIDPDGQTTLSIYFELVLCALRVINAIVVSRGPDNDQTISQARSLLRDYRGFVVAILKRSAHSKPSGNGSDGILQSLADSFETLISMSSFLETPEEKPSFANRLGSFS